MEKHLEVLLANAAQANNGLLRNSLSTNAHDSSHAHLGGDMSSTGKENMSYGIQYQNRDGDESVVWGQGTGTGNTGSDFAGLGDEDLEEKALGLAIEEMWEESGMKWRPWAANGRSIRIGEFVLIVDSDTVVPEDCLRDAAREMKACPTVAIIQHESGTLFIFSLELGGF